ncbi:MAG: helix-turn-helix domain-containing protein [Heyndrickxia sp.]
MTHIGEKIKKLRKEKKLTLADVAKDQMSPAMISLIENGKSKPSAENLKHIADRLGVNVSELMGGSLTTEELRGELSYLLEILDGIAGSDKIEQAITHIKSLLPQLGNNYESARINELYARCLFSYYLDFKSKYDLLEERDWSKYAAKAEELYSDLQMKTRVLKIRFFFALIESYQGNHQKTLELINSSLNNVMGNDYETISVRIDLMLLKIDTVDALGEFEEAFQLLDEIIDYTNKHVMLNRFFEIHNRGALMYYNFNNFARAREFVDKINKFFEIIDNDHLYLEKELILIHYKEFYEDEPEIALDMVNEYEKRLLNMGSVDEEWKSTYGEFAADTKARCYTKLKQPEKALPLFRELLKEDNKHIDYSATDVGIREINKSYQALCHMELNQVEKAKEYAQEAVKKLRQYPHTAYYQFARNVLQEIQMKEFK